MSKQKKYPRGDLTRYAAIIGCLALLLGGIPVAQAATYYVSATAGNDSLYSCTSAQTITTPKRTVQAGMNCLAAGDTLYIRAGTYAENVVYGLTGNPSFPTTIAGYPGDARPVLRPTTLDSSYYGVLKIIGATYAASYATFKGFDLDGIAQTRADDYGTSCISVYMTHTTIEDITCINASRNGIQGSEPPHFAADYLVIRNSRILNCGRIQPLFIDDDTKGIGIYLPANHQLYEDNLIDGCRGGGFNMQYNHSHHSIARGNTIKNAGCASPWGCITAPVMATWAHGIVIGGVATDPLDPARGAHDNEIYNNVIYNMIGSGSGLGACIAWWANSERNAVTRNTCYNSYYGSNTTGAAMWDNVMQDNIFSLVTTGFFLADAGSLVSGNVINFNLTNPNVATTFVNAPGGDFHLLPGAAAQTAGHTGGPVGAYYSIAVATSPTVSITGPVATPTYTSPSSAVTVSGPATDDVAVCVRYTCPTCIPPAATYTPANCTGCGTTNATWSMPLELSPGSNTFTIQAYECPPTGGVLTAEDTIAITWNPPGVTGTYYLSPPTGTPAGNDSRTCAQARDVSGGTPKATWASLCPCLGQGSTVNLYSGTYAGAANAIDSTVCDLPGGTGWDAPTRIQSVTGQTAILRPAVLNGAAVQLLSANNKYIVFDRLVFDGASGTPANASLSAVHILGSAHHIRVQNSEIHHFKGGGLIANGTPGNEFLTNTFHDMPGTDVPYYPILVTNAGVNTLIDGNTVTAMNSACVAIRTEGVGGPVNANNTVIRNACHHPLAGAVNALITLRNTHDDLIANNLLYRGAGGIELSQFVEHELIYNNTITNNTLGSGFGIQLRGGAVGDASRNIEIANNIVFGNTLGISIPAGATATVSTPNLLTTPGFNTGLDVYTLAPGSPAIDTGAVLSVVTTDFAGTVRPINGLYDIGAYEAAAAAIVPGGGYSRSTNFLVQP
jgi:Right handed beta helix region